MKYKIASGHIIQIDSIDKEFLDKYKWFAYKNSGGLIGVRRRHGDNTILLAREILQRKGLTGSAKFVSENRMDFRRSNIRGPKKIEKKKFVPKSGHKYIYPQASGLYQIIVKGHDYVGCTKDIDEAIRMRDEHLEINSRNRS